MFGVPDIIDSERLHKLEDVNANAIDLFMQSSHLCDNTAPRSTGEASVVRIKVLYGS